MLSLDFGREQGRLEGHREQERNQIASFFIGHRGPQSLRHDRNRRGLDRLRTGPRQLARHRRGVHQCQHAVRFALNDSSEGLAVGQLDHARHMVRVDRRVRELDILAHARVVAVNEVGQIGTDLFAFAADAVAFPTRELVAKEQSPAVEPVPARNLGNTALCRRECRVRRLRPRQQKASKRKRARTRVLCGEPGNRHGGRITGGEFEDEWLPAPARGPEQPLCPMTTVAHHRAHTWPA